MKQDHFFLPSTQNKMLCRFPDFEHTKSNNLCFILNSSLKCDFKNIRRLLKVSHYFDHLISSAVVITVHQGYANAVFYLSGKTHL